MTPSKERGPLALLDPKMDGIRRGTYFGCVLLGLRHRAIFVIFNSPNISVLKMTGKIPYFSNFQPTGYDAAAR